jgi:hypothetical protein
MVDGRLWGESAGNEDDALGLGEKSGEGGQKLVGEGAFERGEAEGGCAVDAQEESHEVVAEAADAVIEED